MPPCDIKLGAFFENLAMLRQELHRRPELGFQEYETAAKVASYLEGLGLEVTTGVGGTGVIGLLRGGVSGPVIALRACLDALPVQEASGVSYASEKSGVMHACGHDGNMAMVLGAAYILAKRKEKLRGSVKFIFQPAEEETGGAAAIIAAGALNTPDVGAVITPHNWHGLAQGLVVVKAGPVLASSDIFRIDIHGSPGHGAWPHLAVDPVVAAAEVITGVQRIISRETDPRASAVISIGKIYGGTAVNIIPQTVTLEGTVRAFDRKVQDFIHKRLEEITEGITKAARASYTLHYERIMPPADNEARLTALAREALHEALGPETVAGDFDPGMGCEEFSLFQERIPGLFLFIGNDAPGAEMIPIHSPRYVFNDAILPVGVNALCAITTAYLEKGGLHG